MKEGEVLFDSTQQKNYFVAKDLYPEISTEPLHIFKKGSFSSIGIKENVIQIEVFSHTKVVIIRDGKIPLLINSESLDFPQVDAVLLKSYLEYSAIQLIGLSDGNYKLKTFVRGLGGGNTGSKGLTQGSDNSSSKNTNQTYSSKPATLSVEKKTKLSILCMEGNLSEIQKLLTKPIYTKGTFFSGGDPIILSPCTKGRLDIVKLLVEKGADINVGYTDISGCPLEIAAEEHNELFDYLLEHGAEINISSFHFQTSPLWRACSRGNVYAVKKLAPIVRDIDVVATAHSKEGHTPLAIAALRNYVEVVEILLSNRADPKKIRREVVDELSEVMRQLIFSSGFEEAAQKIAKKISRDLKIEQSFTDEQTCKYQPLIVEALKKAKILAIMSDEANPQTTIDRNNLAEEIKKEIIRYSKSNVSLNNGEIEEGLTDRITIWKSQNQLMNRTVVSKADSTMPSVSRSSLFSPPQAAAQSSSQPVIIERYHQPPKKDFAEDMRQNMNSIAQVENATANLVNAFSNTFGNNSG